MRYRRYARLRVRRLGRGPRVRVRIKFLPKGMVGVTVELNEKNFEDEVLKNDKPVLVDFWAAWCGPCRSMAPIIEEIAREFAGQVKVAKLNVDENQALTARYGIKGIPTLLFFKDGKVVDQEVGYTPKHVVVEKLNKLLS